MECVITIRLISFLYFNDPAKGFSLVVSVHAFVGHRSQPTKHRYDLVCLLWYRGASERLLP